jgi:hypothetical protein
MAIAVTHALARRVLHEPVSALDSVIAKKVGAPELATTITLA